MGGEILQDAPVGEEIFGCHSMGMWFSIAFLLEEWVPPQERGVGGGDAQGSRGHPSQD